MLSRLIAFTAVLLLIPPSALTIAGMEWEAPAPVAGAAWLPALLSMLAVIVFCILLDTLIYHRTNHSLLRSQPGYLLWSSLAGALTGALSAYLNLFAGSWFTPASSPTQALLLAALCGLALLPAVSIARLWLAGLPGLVRMSARRFAFPALPSEPAAKLLLLAALTGLIGGTVWPGHLAWLFWPSPLLLLAALQLLWHESTVFSGLVRGDWSRVLLGSLAGILVGGIALATYRLSGGVIYLGANTWQLIAGMAVSGLLCLQIGDIVAEHWRGRKRAGLLRKKPFPVPIVTKKEP
ncbi:hypothetical protein MIZ01_2116 [Sideroxyarcus emersonii]|uniref:Uncharacterized protein n=2 Tax=Sideroxyarcus emersonii TaxID=2764705 RepID=A0AAN2BZN9_9PROT|nr:hypothetical protein MIZ01_2116 [Sideroxyarcus emersonii]